MNEQRIQELKESLQELIQLFTSGEIPITEEVLSGIAQAMQHVASRIQELRSEESSADGLQSTPEQPELQQAMPSSNIFGFNYDYDNGNLLVKFQGNDGVGQGPVYEYSGVPKYMFDLFKRGAAIAKTTGKNKWGEWWKGKTPSIGAAMNAFIKNGGYPYQKIS